ncbi:hypothetical protein Dform_01430 [Dehalogenimonas formicexedens]|uniref:DinB-like domain-containing protein n=1 Tax=Dehalogenimonas formicexedens TaxID=1839801 RepID=A0A1P8F8F2_9CHLR|nr:DUF664 domain-containing protein [Dehalogenimonas formicexedens]APV44754.1 hypothetical protein Dform_01430 [Dehalogenimonas formicexedens]
MDWRDLSIDGYNRIFELLDPALQGMSQTELNQQPKPDCNSLGWTVWHLARGQDAQIADLAGTEQLWIKDGWHDKFNLPPDPEDTGFGDSIEQVRAFKSPSASVLEYCRAVVAASNRYLKTVNASELNRELDESYQPRPTVGVRIVSIMADALVHAGEAAYIRELIKGSGWLGY